MNLQDLANLGEFISGVAVVVSLVYLAFQVRQNTASLRNESYGRALERLAHLQSKLSTNAQLTAIVGKGAANAGALSPLERIQFSWAFYEMFGACEFMFHQSRAGALPPHVWERWGATLAWWTSMPGVQAWWRARPTPFESAFTAFVEAGIRAGVADADAAKRFEQFVAAGS